MTSPISSVHLVQQLFCVQWQNLQTSPWLCDGSPVSPVVANLCMEEIVESLISNSPVPPKIWKRYVDDSFCIIGKDDVSAFHDTLNSIDTNISFTIETECNGN